jgi:hypothetical protein
MQELQTVDPLDGRLVAFWAGEADFLLAQPRLKFP